MKYCIARTMIYSFLDSSLVVNVCNMNRRTVHELVNCVHWGDAIKQHELTILVCKTSCYYHMSFARLLFSS